MTDVLLDSRKWPDQRHWQYSMERLGEDEHGVWLHIPTGAVAQRGHEPPTTIASGFVTVVPRGTWWLANFYWDDSWRSVYVNIGTPCVWDGDRVTQIDLDLDVVRRLDGTVEIIDEDEFVDHQVRYAYPQDVIDNAWTATTAAAEMLERRDEPFATAANYWLELVGKPDRM